MKERINMTIFRDASAFTTLDNANMGMREDFEKWLDQFDPAIAQFLKDNLAFFETYQIGAKSRQPEIDALKAERDHVYSILQGRTPAQCDFLTIKNNVLQTEINVLKAENERLRKDAERISHFGDQYLAEMKENVSLRKKLSDVVTDMGWNIDKLMSEKNILESKFNRFVSAVKATRHLIIGGEEAYACRDQLAIIDAAMKDFSTHQKE